MGVILHNDDGIEWESDETIYENSFSPNVIHFVMATQLPEGTITHGIREKIWNHMKTLAGQANAVVLAIGGSNDHVHILMDIPRDVRLHRLIDFLRTGLHDWLKANVSNSVGSKWGEKIALQWVGDGEVNTHSAYIMAQSVIHKSMSFDDEYREYQERAKMGRALVFEEGMPGKD